MASEEIVAIVGGVGKLLPAGDWRIIPIESRDSVWCGSDGTRKTNPEYIYISPVDAPEQEEEGGK